MVTIDVTVLHETAAALKVLHEGEELWIPKSQIIPSESDVLATGDVGTLAITDYIAAEKGLD